MPLWHHFAFDVCKSMAKHQIDFYQKQGVNSCERLWFSRLLVFYCCTSWHCFRTSLHIYIQVHISGMFICPLSVKLNFATAGFLNMVLSHHILEKCFLWFSFDDSNITKRLKKPHPTWRDGWRYFGYKIQKHCWKVCIRCVPYLCLLSVVIN